MDKVMELYVKSIAAVSQPQKGQGLVEYGLILALIAVVCVGALTLLGTSIDGMLSALAANL